MTTLSETVRLPSADESIAPVTILDAQGRVLRVVSAEDSRRARPTAMAERLDDVGLGAGPRAASRRSVLSPRSERA